MSTSAQLGALDAQLGSFELGAISSEGGNDLAVALSVELGIEAEAFGPIGYAVEAGVDLGLEAAVVFDHEAAAALTLALAASVTGTFGNSVEQGLRLGMRAVVNPGEDDNDFELQRVAASIRMTQRLPERGTAR